MHRTLARRQWRGFWWSLGIALALAACSSERDESAAVAVTPADMLLYNGRVYMVDAGRSWAEAIAIRDGRIIWVGDDVGRASWVGENTQLVDLQGHMVLPGFQDAHTHPVVSGWEYLQCPLFESKGVDALLARIAGCVALAPADGSWVQGSGWLVSDFAPSGLPDKKLLDAIAPDRPLAMYSTDGHSLWVNSAALAAAGITADTPNPPEGRIDRYPGSTEPSGSLQEDSAMALVQAVIPAPSPEDLEEGLRYARNLFHSLGITAVQDAKVKLHPGDAYYGLDTYHTLDDRGTLNLHVVAAMLWDPKRSLADQLPEFIATRDRGSRGEVRANTVKIFQDGVVETQTAAMLAPYTGRVDGYRGDLLNSQAALNEAVLALDAAGFQIHLHAIGDGAIRSSLDALEQAWEHNGSRDSRHHIAHIEIFDPADIPRFARLGVAANFQPLWALNDEYITELTVPIIGPERSRWLYPIASLQRSGARVVFGSDWSVSSANPLDGIEVAVTRLDPDGAGGEPLLPGEAISLADAIAHYTIDSAWVNFLDAETGSIEAGKLADLVVLDRDLFAGPPEQINEAKVLATLFGGKLVYGSLD